MKLDAAQIDLIRSQIGIQPIPEAESAHSRLEENFGEHTFYLDPMGLYIWETCDESETKQTEVMALQIATWTDEGMTVLEVHTPKPTGQIVVLNAIH